ncbi:MAG: EF-P lysine aminoacylase EpmA [Leucothrix sp.]
MQWQPDGDQPSRIARANMLRAIREFFYERQVLEVETPALSASGNTDPFIESFTVNTDCSGHPEKRYLHTSPEYPMKRLLAAGSGDIYQLCKVWRAEPSSGQHNAEFTMLEYYRLGFDLPMLMDEVNQLLLLLLPNLNTASQFSTYAALFLDKLMFNPHTIANEDLQVQVNRHVPEFTGDLDRQASLDLLLTHCIEPFFPNDRLTFIYDYPATQSALAKTTASSDTPDAVVAKRFEVYAGTAELGNGYQELTSADANEAVLQSERQMREERNLPPVALDQRFLAATQAGLPECAGIAIGIDRLLMLQTGAATIQQVINFSWENA